MTAATRIVMPGDNRLGMDVVVRARPFLRGIKAARHFTMPKDEGGSFTCVRVMPTGSTVVISAANPLTMFSTGVQMMEAPFNDAGVLDLPVWLVDQILAVFKPANEEIDLRITAHRDEQRVKICESTGLFNVNVHQWAREAMDENAPDVPSIIDEVFAQPAVTDQPQLISPQVAHPILQAAKIMQAEYLIDQERNHYRFRFGGYARAISVLPSPVKEMREMSEEFHGALSEDQLEKSAHVVAAIPPKGMA